MTYQLKKETASALLFALFYCNTFFKGTCPLLTSCTTDFFVVFLAYFLPLLTKTRTLQGQVDWLVGFPPVYPRYLAWCLAPNRQSVYVG